MAERTSDILLKHAARIEFDYDVMRQSPSPEDAELIYVLRSLASSSTPPSSAPETTPKCPQCTRSASFDTFDGRWWCRNEHCSTVRVAASHSPGTPETNSRVPHFDPSRVDELTEAQAIALHRALRKEWPMLAGTPAPAETPSPTPATAGTPDVCPDCGLAHRVHAWNCPRVAFATVSIVPCSVGGAPLRDETPEAPEVKP